MSELTDFLTARGYVRVPLRRSVVGHFHTNGTLNAFDAHAAVIDYATGSLFLKAVAVEPGAAPGSPERRER